MKDDRKTRRRFLEDVAPGGGPAALGSCRPAATGALGAEEEEQPLARLHALSRSHPRLHFDADGLAALQGRVGSTHHRCAERLLERVEKNRGSSPSVDVPGRRVSGPTTQVPKGGEP